MGRRQVRTVVAGVLAFLALSVAGCATEADLHPEKRPVPPEGPWRLELIGGLACGVMRPGAVRLALDGHDFGAKGLVDAMDPEWPWIPGDPITGVCEIRDNESNEVRIKVGIEPILSPSDFKKVARQFEAERRHCGRPQRPGIPTHAKVCPKSRPGIVTASMLFPTRKVWIEYVKSASSAQSDAVRVVVDLILDVHRNLSAFERRFTAVAGRCSVQKTSGAD